MKRTIICLSLAFVAVSTVWAVRACFRTPTTWGSFRLAAVQEEFDALNASFPPTTKSNAREQSRKLDDTLRKRLSNRDLRNLAASCDKLPIREEDRSLFENWVFSYMVFAFVDSGDRETLVRLLSTRSRTHLAVHTDIEYCLLVRGEKTLRDPILILGEAYAKCNIPEVRRDIAAAIRRGFDTMHIPGLETGTLSDDEYVKTAMEWYNAHKEDLVPNLEYIHNAVMGWPNYALFTSKSETAKKK